VLSDIISSIDGDCGSDSGGVSVNLHSASGRLMNDLGGMGGAISEPIAASMAALSESSTSEGSGVGGLLIPSKTFCEVCCTLPWKSSSKSRV